jgi:hypothetical protein
VREPIESCGRCADGWVCEDHPDQAYGHGCGGAGMPCESPDCRFSILKTGLVCPSCRQAMGTIETQTNRLIAFTCKGCAYQWRAETRRVAGQRRELQ